MVEMESGVDLDAPIEIGLRGVDYCFPSMAEMSGVITQHLLHKWGAGRDRAIRRSRKSLVKLFDAHCMGVRDFHFSSKSELNKWKRSVPKQNKLEVCCIFDDMLPSRIVRGTETLVELEAGLADVVFRFPGASEGAFVDGLAALKRKLALTFVQDRRVNMVKWIAELRGSFAKLCTSVDGVDLLLVDGWQHKMPPNWVFRAMTILCEEDV